MNTKAFFFLLLASISGWVSAHEAQHAAVWTAAQPLAARYEVKSGKVGTDWYLWRAEDSVETADVATGQGWIWERSGQNDYSYQRIFHADRRIVEYTPGEIRTRHAEPDWTKLSSVVSPQMLTALKPGARKTLFGQPAVQYSGAINGQTVKLWWLPQAQLPAQLEIRGGTQNLRMTLKELHSQAPAAWPRATEMRVAAYARLDAADLGDMESDPFVAKLMQMDGHAHAH